MVAAVRSPGGASAELLRRARSGRLTLLASVALFLEYEAVLLRDEHLQAAGLTESDMEVLLDALAMIVEPVRIHYLWRPQLRDPDDEMVLETAVNGRADAIATFNERDFASVARSFDIMVMSPRRVLEELER